MGRVSNRALGNYLSEISKFEPLDPRREIVLTQQIKQGDTQAQHELIVANLRFVVSVAKKFQGQGRPLEDLISEGNIGLIKAAKRFDESRGFKFISYAVWWVRQAILQSLSEHSRMVRVPLNRQGDITRIVKATEELEHQYEREPLVEEIAKRVERLPHEVAHTIQISRRHQSLDMPFSDVESNSLMDVIPDRQMPDPDASLALESLKKEISSTLGTLKERERRVIKMYFGIDQDYALTLNEIGEEFHLTRERVRQIKEKAIRRLQHKSRSTNLRPYL
ncbi:MAG: sigma-70 family RNA polymerase sigma factor [Candidatus Marinimicrobia bacterium]|nr:sigma-70 family RNA polymerase sigma factor [Candidatus Neomarinimicrobiota bacterium]